MNESNLICAVTGLPFCVSMYEKQSNNVHYNNLELDNHSYFWYAPYTYEYSLLLQMCILYHILEKTICNIFNNGPIYDKIRGLGE